MKLQEALLYLVGADYLKEHIADQQRLLAENIGNEKPHLPLDGDLKTAGRFYLDRLRTVVEYPVVVASRVTGVDATLRNVRAQFAKNK